MRARATSFLALVFPAAVAVILACGASPYGNACESLGGACVTDDQQCGGTLPYACTVGVCCVPNGAAAPGDAGPPNNSVPDATLPVVVTPPGDSGTDATLSPDVTTSTPDAETSGPDATTGVDAPAEAETPDQSAPVDAGHDASTPPVDAGESHDAATHDAATHDAGVDAEHDASTTADASGPSCPGYSAPGTADLCTACVTQGQTCNPNGCFGTYYCETLTLTCVRPSKVVCDAGL